MFNLLFQVLAVISLQDAAIIVIVSVGELMQLPRPHQKTKVIFIRDTICLSLYVHVCVYQKDDGEHLQ